MAKETKGNPNFKGAYFRFYEKYHKFCDVLDDAQYGLVMQALLEYCTYGNDTLWFQDESLMQFWQALRSWAIKDAAHCARKSNHNIGDANAEKRYFCFYVSMFESLRPLFYYKEAVFGACLRMMCDYSLYGKEPTEFSDEYVENFWKVFKSDYIKGDLV